MSRRQNQKPKHNRKKRGQYLWGQFYALKATILQLQAEGKSEVHEGVVEARRKQRKVAEAMSLEGFIKGIAFKREGDYHPSQKELVKGFDAPPQHSVPMQNFLAKANSTDGTYPQVIALNSLSFRSEAGELMHIDHPPSSQLIGMESIRMEGKAAGVRNDELSVLHGEIGKDYVVDRDPESGMEFYRPTGGRDG